MVFTTLQLQWALSILNLSLLLASVSVALTSLVPPLQSFLKYGKTLKLKHDKLPFLNIYVPKCWFTHFYIIHFTLSVVNVCLIMGHQFTFTDLQVISIINLIQSSRRLFECLFVSNFSKTSNIHIFHYLVGVYFYTTINIIPLVMYLLDMSNDVSVWGMIVPIIIFTIASLDQSYNHKILSKQKKYTIPKIGLFQYVVCPHYFDEIIIYGSIFLIKPSISFSLVVVWVAVNLSISANESFHFHKSQDEIKFQKRIFPFIY